MMAITIQQLLKNHQVSVDALAKAARVDKDDLQDRLHRPVDTWTIGLFNAMAAAVNQTPSHLLAQLQDESFTLEIDPQKQTVQGLEVTDRYVFSLIQSVVKISCMEGWQPTAAEIVDLVSIATSAQPKLDQDFEQIFGE